MVTPVPYKVIRYQEGVGIRMILKKPEGNGDIFYTASLTGPGMTVPSLLISMLVSVSRIADTIAHMNNSIIFYTLFMSVCEYRHLGKIRKIVIIRWLKNHRFW